jgi:16S rRNA (cytidine1402-2'-O)-methyltransferase
MAGTLYVVATPIGNLEDITARALRVLREVQLIAAEDTRRTGNLLSRFGIATPTTSLHEHNEHDKSPSLIARLEEGDSIALVSDAGTPGISDPGAALVRAASNAGIRVEPIPGPSALTALLSVSGLPAQHFSFFGFPPTRSSDRKRWLQAVSAAQSVAVFYEAPHRIRRTLGDLQREVGDVTVVIGRELTKAHEQLVKGPISDASTRVGAGQGEFVVAIDLGERRKQARDEPWDAVKIAAKVRDLTENFQLTRRQAIARISQLSGQTARQVYSALEEQKSSVS